uniref:Profilin n=1 Tax=Pseudodiaptomus annandalei TaxID=298510 RepID=V9P292_9MAXI|nr:profilin [Pseudodiaptomus annandalei]
MSWQQYVDTQMIQKQMSKAAIAGQDGSIWAKSNGFNLTPDEVKKILDSYNDPSILASGGINIEGRKYFFLSGTDDVIRGKQGKGGVHLVKTTQTLLIGIYEEPMAPAQAATITESLGEYLKGFGY